MEMLRAIDPNTKQSVSWSWNMLRVWQITKPSTEVDRLKCPSSLTIKVDTTWYMQEGPGTYFNPAQFSVVSNVLNRNPSELGLANGESRSLKSLLNYGSTVVRLSHYTTDVNNESYGMRSWIWGGTSATIDGEIKNIDGKLALTNYKIAPRDDNFNFHHEGEWTVDNTIKNIVNAVCDYYSERLLIREFH